jgi:hypothetical protein
MKMFIICIALVLVPNAALYAQDIEAKLSGSTGTQGFTVKDNSSTSLFTVRGNGKVGIGTTTPAANLHVGGLDGFLVTGTFNSGTIPATGAGTRMMFYPKKAAFRAGYVGGTEWDDANIGDYSTAMGYNTTASGGISTAMGAYTTASGPNSTAMGHITAANGNASTAMGEGTSASGSNSTAMGSMTTASGHYSTAMGFNTIASGYWSTAMGSSVSTNGKSGAFLIGDHSSTISLLAGGDDGFATRFAGGYTLFTNSTCTTGAQLLPNANSWSSLSDSTKKENIISADGESYLRKFGSLRLGSWNYKGRDVKEYRHYGPMAQEWFAAFGRDGIGTIGNDTTLASADVDGVLCIAVQALEKRTAEIDKKTAELQQKTDEIASLKEKVASLESAQAQFAAQATEVRELRNDLAALKALLTNKSPAGKVDHASLDPGK